MVENYSGLRHLVAKFVFWHLQSFIIGVSGSFDHGKDHDDQDDHGPDLSEGDAQVPDVQPALVARSVVLVADGDGDKDDAGRESPAQDHVLGSIEQPISGHHLAMSI